MTSLDILEPKERLRSLKEMLHSATFGFNPRSANSFCEKLRLRKPRSSPKFSGSITKAPLSFVSLKMMPMF